MLLKLNLLQMALLIDSFLSWNTMIRVDLMLLGANPELAKLGLEATWPIVLNALEVNNKPIP